EFVLAPGFFADSFNAIVNSGGLEDIAFNGRSFFSQVNGGGFQLVGSGGLAVSATIGGGAFADNAVQHVSGGTANNDTVLLGGVVSVTDGINGMVGVTNAALIFGGGTERVSAGGQSSATTLTANALGRAQEFVFSGGEAFSTVVNGGGGNAGILDVFEGGRTSNTTVNAGGFELVNGGTFNFPTSAVSENATINAGGNQLVFSGGHAFNGVVSTGGAQILEGL